MHDDGADPVRFLISLNRKRVRWLLIGRQALIHHGVPAQTMDYDLWVDPTPANLENLLKVAREVGLATPSSVQEIEAKPLFSLFGDTVKIDVFKVRTFTNPDGETIDFAPAYRRRVTVRVKGDPLVPSLPTIADLRKLKRMRDGEKDREDLRFLDLLEARRKRRRRA